MRILGLLISLLLHASIITLAMTWAVSSPVKISLDMPVYQVDLISLAPAPSAPSAPKAPAKPVESLSKPGAVAIPEAVTSKKAPKPKVIPVKPVEAKPVVPKAQPKPEPKVEKISTKKIKTTNPPKKKVAEKKVEKPATPVKKVAPKKKETPPPKPAKPVKPAKPKLTAEQILAADLAAIGNIVENQKKAEQQAVANDLASLSKTAESTAIQGADSGTPGASGLVQVYASIVMQEVKKNWRYPVFGQGNDLSARVQISLEESGRITDIKLLDSSGNVDFDDSVLTALRDTEVLPEPPGSSIRTIIVNFNLHDLDQ
ncbi:energy transducer TonB [Maridesulfovibrio frigidus]|uniref:energy transducer TonB n=1 Tax=Maridesulfovibrio frigidus TaxID=340956 RepID=UPI0004E23C8E|nr:TonB family protein [Maridesulfovibrio frigidus]